MPSFEELQRFIAPDEEVISLDDAIERVYNLTRYSLGEVITDSADAEDVALNVIDGICLLWKKSLIIVEGDHEASKESAEEDSSSIANGNSEASQDSGEKSTKPYKSLRNPAFSIDHTLFKKLDPYKRAWVSDVLEKRRNVDEQTLDVWFMEDLVSHCLICQGCYMAVAIGNLLFNYKEIDVFAAYQLLDSKWDDPEEPDGASMRKSGKADRFRRAKESLNDRYYSEHTKGDERGQLRNFLGYLLKTETRGPHNKKRFVRRPGSPEKFEFVIQTLEHLTPLQPSDPFPWQFYENSFDPDARDLEKLLERFAQRTGEALDSERIHVVLHPRCWRCLFKAMRMESPEKKLELPEYDKTKLGVGSGSPPIDRNQISPMSDELRKRIKWKLEKKKLRRANYNFQSVDILVDNEKQLEISLDFEKTVPYALELEHGESLIEIVGHDAEGPLLLGMQIVPWIQSFADGSVRFISRLGKTRRLEFLVTYHRDEFGEPDSATASIVYAREPQKAFGVKWAAVAAALCFAIVGVTPTKFSLSPKLIFAALTALTVGFSIGLIPKIRESLLKAALVSAFFLALTVFGLQWHMLKSRLPTTLSGSDARVWFKSESSPISSPSLDQRKDVEATADKTPERQGAGTSDTPFPRPIEKPAPKQEQGSLDQREKKESSPAAFLPPSKPVDTPKPEFITRTSEKPQAEQAVPVINDKTSATDTHVTEVTGRGAIIPVSPNRLPPKRSVERQSATLGKDQVIESQMLDFISSNKTKSGDIFITAVSTPVSVGDDIVIPKGSRVLARVVKATPAANSSQGGLLEVEFYAIDLPHYEQQITGLLDDCRRNVNEDTRWSSAAKGTQRRQKFVFFGDSKNGAVVKPINERLGSTRIKQSFGYLDSPSIGHESSNEARVQPGMKVCFALSKSVSFLLRHD
jgi:hypothetical protein